MQEVDENSSPPIAVVLTAISVEFNEVKKFTPLSMTIKFFPFRQYSFHNIKVTHPKPLQMRGFY
jgi:hypothetical protein